MARRYLAPRFALFAILTMSATLAAPTAQAEADGRFTLDTASALVIANAVGDHVFEFEDGLTVKCKKAIFEGVGFDLATSISVGVEYKECTGLGGNVTVDMNGCDYEVIAGKAGGTDVYNGSISLTCPAGKAVVFTAGKCEIKIGAQKLSPVRYENRTGPHDLTVEPAAESIKYTKVEDGDGCPLTGTGDKSDGKYTGTSTMVSKSLDTGEPTGLEIIP